VAPVLIPNTLEHQTVNLGLENFMCNLVVLVGVYTKLHSLIVRNQLQALTAGLGLILLRIIICVGSKASNLYSACSDSLHRVNHDSNGWIIHHLLSLLCFHINA